MNLIRQPMQPIGQRESEGSWVETNEVHYLYDGNVVIQERDANNLPVVAYTRGTDMRGSLHGAGGIGGLLAMSLSPVVNPQHYYYHADGNGNVTALINGLQFIAAKYMYDPYGNLLSKVGLIADLNPYQFSSKEHNANSGLIYYLYRFYDPNLQRWQNREPIGGWNDITVKTTDNNKFNVPNWEYFEGPNLYTYVFNSPILYSNTGNGEASAGFKAGWGPLSYSAQKEWSGPLSDLSFLQSLLPNISSICGRRMTRGME